MDEFTHLSVFLSIILGLAVTEILTGFRGLLQARARVLLYWPALLWCFLLLLIYAQTWWSMFGLRLHHDWTFAAFSVVLLQTIVQYMLAGIALPHLQPGEPVDLRAHYFSQRRWFCALLLLGVGVSLAKDLVLNGHLPDAKNVIFHAIFASFALTGVLTRREWFHRVFAVVMAILIALYIVLLFARLD